LLAVEEHDEEALGVAMSKLGARIGHDLVPGRRARAGHDLLARERAAPPRAPAWRGASIALVAEPRHWQRSAARWRGDRAGEARSARRSARAQRPHVALRDREEQRLEQVRVAERGALAAPELRAQPRATPTRSLGRRDALGGGAVARGSVVLSHRPSVRGDAQARRLRPDRADGVSPAGEAVKISHPSSVTPIECSNCAESDLSRVTAVQPLLKHLHLPVAGVDHRLDGEEHSRLQLHRRAAGCRRSW
jgi:hypothetical protein